MYQRIVESLLYPLLMMKQGSRELAVLDELLESERFSPDRLHELRLRRLREVLIHASRNVPFYQRRFREAGFNPESVKDFSDLKGLPVLSKRDIQNHREELISRAFTRADLTENRTGGSTGSPLVFYHDPVHWNIRSGATLRHNLWAGYRVGDKVALIWGHQQDLSALQSFKAKLRNKLIDRFLICDSSSMTDESLIRFSQEYQSFKPDVILAYANSLAMVVDFAIKHDIELPAPKTIITSAEVLTTETREKIEKYFGIKIFDRYGSRESSVIASECSAHDGMHIGAEYLHLEFVNGDRAVAPGETGEILLTVLGNHAFPFIRYQIGDMGSPQESGTCSCGVTLPKMHMLAGRTTDFLLSPDGRKVSGAALTIFLAAKVPGVKQAQIVQRDRGALEFRLVTNTEFSEASRLLIEERVRHFFGDSMRVVYKYVEAIPREASGKYRFSICELQ